MNKVAVVIVAGGTGSRMNSKVKKQYLKLQDKEVLAHTVERFEHIEEIKEIIVVTGKEDIPYVRELLCQKYNYSKVKEIVEGGKERQDSVYNGLQVVDKGIQYIAIHDGARPLIKEETVKEAIEVCVQKGGCIVAVPVKDTIKKINASGIVEETPSRETLWAVQTPQIFSKEVIVKAYEEGRRLGIQATDDSMLVEALGEPVYCVEGDYTNIKLTTPEDLEIANRILETRRRG